jgi:hypothetical protein
VVQGLTYFHSHHLGKGGRSLSSVEQVKKPGLRDEVTGSLKKQLISAGRWWLTLVILATQRDRDLEDHSSKPA